MESIVKNVVNSKISPQNNKWFKMNVENNNNCIQKNKNGRTVFSFNDNFSHYEKKQCVVEKNEDDKVYDVLKREIEVNQIIENKNNILRSNTILLTNNEQTTINDQNSNKNCVYTIKQNGNENNMLDQNIRIPLSELDLNQVKKNIKCIPPELYNLLRKKPFVPTPDLQSVELTPEIAACIPPPKYLELKNQHPRDKRIKFVEKNHVYYIDNVAQYHVSSTKFIKCFFNPFDAEKQAEKTINSASHFKKICQQSYEYNNCSKKEDIINIWNKRRDLGTLHHACIESFINREPYDIHPENKWCFEQQFMSLYTNKSFFKWRDYRTEWCIFDERTKIPGSIDYFGMTENNRGVIIDWKLCKSIRNCSFERLKGQKPLMGKGCCSSLEDCNAILYFLQICLYKYIIERNYGIKVDHMFIVQMHPSMKEKSEIDGKKYPSKHPVVYKVPDMTNIICEMMATYEIVNDL
jgi:hypothetical protein